MLYGKITLADPATDILGTDGVPIYFTDGGSASFHSLYRNPAVLHLLLALSLLKSINDFGDEQLLVPNRYIPQFFDRDNFVIRFFALVTIVKSYPCFEYNFAISTKNLYPMPIP